MKKALYFLLTLTLCLGLCVPAQAIETTFTDVPAGSWYADAVDLAVSKGITEGTSATTFSPSQTCTRGQIITFLWRAAGAPEPVGTPAVTDAGNTYYTKAILWAEEKGMFDGNTFFPDSSCTRAMAVEFLWRQAGSPAVPTTTVFADVPDDASYAQAVAWALKEGVTTGTSATEFSPDKTCSRAQIVTFLSRALWDGNSESVNGVYIREAPDGDTYRIEVVKDERLRITMYMRSTEEASISDTWEPLLDGTLYFNGETAWWGSVEITFGSDHLIFNEKGLDVPTNGRYDKVK